jgi:hypothetical protein
LNCGVTEFSIGMLAPAQKNFSPRDRSSSTITVEVLHRS